MDKLSGEDLKIACKVLEQRYKACIKESLVYDVLSNVDTDGPSRKCGGLYATIKLHCLEVLPAMKSTAAAQQHE